MQIEKAKVEVLRLAAAGSPVALIEVGGQPYVLVRRIPAPAPPWGASFHDILIVIPVAYDAGAALDAFYLRLPYQYHEGTHNRVNGGTITYDGADWQLVSWHYADGKPYQAGVDTIEAHIEHCKGFFFNRGATNAST